MRQPKESFIHYIVNGDFDNDHPHLSIFSGCLVAAIIVGAVIGVILFLLSIHPLLGFAVLLIICNISSYYASYHSHSRKPWFFPVCLLLSIIIIVWFSSILLS